MKKMRLSELIKDYKFNSVFLKNLRMLIALISIPLFTMSIIGYFYYDSVVKKEISETYIQSLSKTRNYMDGLLTGVQRLIVALSTDEYVQIFMTASDESLSTSTILKRDKNIRNLISTLLVSNDMIDSIYVYSEVNQFVISKRTSGSAQNFFDNAWISSYLADRNSLESFIEPRKVFLYG